MRNLIIFMTTMLCGILSSYSQEQTAAPLKYVPNSFRSASSADVPTSEAEMGSINMAGKLANYRMDTDGNGKTGCLIVRFKNMANADIENFGGMTVINGRGAQGPEQHDLNGIKEMWYYIDPATNADLTISHKTLGQVKIPDVTIEREKLYVAEVECEKLADVSFTSDMDGTTVVFDSEKIGTASISKPVTKERVPYGTYRVTYYNGKHKKDDIIEVGEGSTTFVAEIRPRVIMEFITNEPGSKLYIDDKYIGQMPLKDVVVAVGPHKIKAEGVSGMVEEAIDISERQTLYEVKMFKTKPIEFYANYNNSRTSGASVYVNNTYRGVTPLTIELPYGSYNVNMSYYGNNKKGKLHVGDNTPNDFSLNIPPSHRSFNPFDIEYRKRTWGLSASFVEKWYHIKAPDNYTINLDYWLNEKKMMGFQVGVPVQPIFGYGLGMNTGAFVECYFNGSGEGVTYTEVDLYVPVHFMFRLPLAEEFSVFVNGGVGFDFGLAASLSDGEDSVDLSFGDDEMANMFNMSGEFGGGIQFKALQLSAQYSIGLLNNGSFLPGDDDFTVKPYKLSFTIGLMF